MDDAGDERGDSEGSVGVRGDDAGRRGWFTGACAVSLMGDG